MKWKARGYEIDLEIPRLMGVLNVTPDSFSDGGMFFDPDTACRRAFQLVRQGADILDIGAESTRPGARPVSVVEELERLLPVIDGILGKVPVPVSVDTTKPEVAEACLQKGVHVINDVSGLKDSGPRMAELVRRFGAGLVLMHRRGDAASMQSLNHYGDVVGEVLEELRASVEMARRAGIGDEHLVVDPGLGFAKNTEQNLAIVHELERFQELGLPVLLGPSRKTFIGEVTGKPKEEREFGTAAVVALAVYKGVRIVRVHEVGWMKDVVEMISALQGANYVRAF